MKQITYLVEVNDVLYGYERSDLLALDVQLHKENNVKIGKLYKLRPTMVVIYDEISFESLETPVKEE